MKQKIFLATSMLGAVIVLSGCWPFPSKDEIGQKIVEKAIESQTGGKININTDKGTVDINTKDGSLSTGKEVKIPENFPKDIFVFSDAQVVFAMSGTSGEKSYSISYFTASTPEDAFAKYKEEMVSKGWQKESEMDMGAQGKIVNFKKGQLSIMVTIGTSEDEESKGKTQISVISNEETSETSESTSSSAQE
jgi:hypothetical protein